MRCVQGFVNEEEKKFPFAIVVLRKFSVRPSEENDLVGGEGFDEDEIRVGSLPSLPISSGRRSSLMSPARSSVVVSRRGSTGSESFGRNSMNKGSGGGVVDDNEWCMTTKKEWSEIDGEVLFDFSSPIRSNVRIHLKEIPGIWREIGPGFYNARVPFGIYGGLMDAGGQFSMIKLSNGKFLVVDTADPNGVITCPFITRIMPLSLSLCYVL